MVFVWSLLALMALLVALLAIPLEWAFNVRQEQGLREANSHVRWLFGVVQFRTSGAPDAGKKAKPAKPRKPQKKSRRSSPLAVVSVEGFVGRVLTLVRRLLSSIHIHHLNLQARLGLGDAADTGRLWAYIGPLSVLLAQTKASRVTIEPDFYDEVLDFTSDGRIQVIPLKLLTLLLGFLLSFNTLRAWRAMRGSR